MTDHLDDDPNCDAAYDGEQCELALGHTGDHMSHNDDWPATVRDASRQAAGQPAAELCGCGLQGPHEPSALCGPAAAQPDPTIADDPTPLRWGLGDVLHSDDGTLIVCLSGPDREPYWLELDPERAAALRNDLAGPEDADEDLVPYQGEHGYPDGEEPQDHHGSEHPMARALRLGAVAIPDAIAAEISEATNSGLPMPWPEYTDRDADVWHLTDETHDGDRVMLPAAGDMAPMLRRDVQRFFGPLTAAGLAAPTNHNTETQARGELHAFMTAAFQGYDIPPVVQQEINRLTDAYRAAILHSAAQAAESERLHEELGTPEDEAYNEAVSDTVTAIRRLAAGAES